LLSVGERYATQSQRNGQSQVFWFEYVLSEHRVEPFFGRSPNSIDAPKNPMSAASRTLAGDIASFCRK
jgi:hypothetical protein